MGNINIKFATDEFAETLKKNSGKVAESLQDNPSNNSWMLQLVDTPYIQKAYIIEHFQ